MEISREDYELYVNSMRTAIGLTYKYGNPKLAQEKLSAAMRWVNPGNQEDMESQARENQIVADIMAPLLMPHAPMQSNTDDQQATPTENEVRDKKPETPITVDKDPLKTLFREVVKPDFAESLKNKVDETNKILAPANEKLKEYVRQFISDGPTAANKEILTEAEDLAIQAKMIDGLRNQADFILACCALWKGETASAKELFLQVTDSDNSLLKLGLSELDNYIKIVSAYNLDINPEIVVLQDQLSQKKENLAQIEKAIVEESLKALEGFKSPFALFGK